MELKACTIQDLKELINITQTTYREHYQYLWKDKGEQYILANYTVTALSKEIKNTNLGVYFIMEANETYGFLKLQFDASFENHSAKDALELARIYLLKKGIGKGLGKAVMQAVDKIAIKLDKKVVWLKTMDSSEAATFYQNYGYEVCGETTLNVAGIYKELQRQLILKKKIKTI